MDDEAGAPTAVVTNAAAAAAADYQNNLATDEFAFLPTEPERDSSKKHWRNPFLVPASWQ